MNNLGIDLGGSHVAIGVISDEGEILEQYEKDFTIEEKQNLMEVAIDFIVNTVNSIKEKNNFTKLGIGIAGSISNGIVLRSVNLGIQNYNIKSVLEEKTGLQVTVKNDAKCAAFAEYKFGNGKNFKNVLFLSMGTGIGGAFIYDEKLISGDKFEGLEIGHMVIKAGGVPCKCGNSGCFERYGSILVFKNKVIERLHLPYNLSGVEIREEIENHKDEIEDIIDEYTCDLALGISNLVNIFEPDCIILGGGFARYENILLQKVKEKLINSDFLFNKRDDICLEVAKFGNEAGIIGASCI